MNMGS